MLVLHTLLVLITLITAASNDGAEARALMDGIVTLVLCGLYPLCGFSALAGEIKANTMDMLVLTRLSAWRIVMGKWAAVVFQSLLVTVSVVPYLVARYVFGGSELFTDLHSLFSQWLLSAVLTAGVVALSTQKQFWLRALILCLPLILAGIGSIARITVGMMGGTSFSLVRNQGFWAFAGGLLGMAWLIFALLSFGASRIAPAASLLPVTKRLVNLAALLVLPAIQWLAVPNSSLHGVILCVLVVASVDALTEDVRSLPSIYLPFYRRSWWGRTASWFLAPGWMHGFLYSLLLFFISITALWLIQGWEAAAQVWLIGCCLWLSALFAQVLAIQRRGEYLSAMFAGVCLMALFSTVNFLLTKVSAYKTDLEWLACFWPVNAFWVSQTKWIGGWSLFQISLVVNAVWPAALVMPALLAFLRTRHAREEARHLLGS